MMDLECGDICQLEGFLLPVWLIFIKDRNEIANFDLQKKLQHLCIYFLNGSKT